MVAAVAGCRRLPPAVSALISAVLCSIPVPVVSPRLVQLIHEPAVNGQSQRS